MPVSYVDILLLLPLIIGLVRGLMRGLITELIAILGVVLGAIGAHLGAPSFTAWLQAHFIWPEAVYNLVAYTLLFLAIAIACNLIGRFISKVLKAIHLSWLNRLAGGLFGMLKWGFIVLVITYGVSTLDEKYHFLQPQTLSQSVCWPYAVAWSHDGLSLARSEFGK